MKRILCIWVPHWPIQRLDAARPEPEDRCAFSNLQFDICNLQFAISPLPPEPPDPTADREALLELAAWCRRFSPIVGVEDSPTPECLFLDITGLDHLFGGETALAGKIVKDFADRGLVVRIAIADTLGAAWAVARFGDGKWQIANGKREIDKNLVPTLCAGTHGGDALRRCLPRPQSGRAGGSHAERGNEEFDICSLQFAICNLPPGQSFLALKPLPIEALRLPPETVELLHSLGIVRIEQLESLPREELNCRFGPRLLQRWDQAIGNLSEPIPVQLPPPTFSARHELEYPTASRETVAFVVEQLIARLAEMLIRSGRGAVQLECRLDCQWGAPVALSVGLFQPTASPRHLNSLILMHLERASIPSPILAISIEATLTGPLDRRQEELFADGPARRRPRLLAALIDRLASRLGRRSVLQPRLAPEAQPELAYQCHPLVLAQRGRKAVGWVSRPVPDGSGEPSSMKREKRRPEQRRGRSEPRATRRAVRCAPGVPLACDLPPRPLRLLQRPVAISAISIMPDGPPFSFRLGNREHRIVWIWGPERIETGWWRGRPIARDYYRVETATGHRFWLFRSLEERRWFLHGTFE